MSRARNILDFIAEQDPETMPAHGLNTAAQGYAYQGRHAPDQGLASGDTKSSDGTKQVGTQKSLKSVKGAGGTSNVARSGGSLDKATL